MSRSATGRCDTPPASATSLSLLDLALIAGSGHSSDFDCDGTIDLVDLAIWAGGINVSCDPAGCP